MRGMRVGLVPSIVKVENDGHICHLNAVLSIESKHTFKKMKRELKINTSPQQKYRSRKVENQTQKITKNVFSFPYLSYSHGKKKPCTPLHMTGF